MSRLIGGIDGEGHLYIKRSAENDGKDQECPFKQAEEPSYCGDWCPLFGEPHVEKLIRERVTHLSLCHGKHLEFSTFSDDRVEPEQEVEKP